MPAATSYICCRLCGIFSCDCKDTDPCKQGDGSDNLGWVQSPNSERFYPENVDKALKAYARKYRIEAKR